MKIKKIWKTVSGEWGQLLIFDAILCTGGVFLTLKKMNPKVLEVKPLFLIILALAAIILSTKWFSFVILHLIGERKKKKPSNTETTLNAWVLSVAIAGIFLLWYFYFK